MAVNKGLGCNKGDEMEVMSNYNFYDEDIEKVLWNAEIGMHKEIREIVLKDEDADSICISKEDIINLAKEFNLVVYEKDAHY